MNQQGINLSGSAIFFEDIEIVQNLFIAIELVQDLTKLVFSLFSLVIFEFPRGSLGLLEIVRFLTLAGRPIRVPIFPVFEQLITDKKDDAKDSHKCNEKESKHFLISLKIPNSSIAQNKERKIFISVKTQQLNNRLKCV